MLMITNFREIPWGFAVEMDNVEIAVQLLHNEMNESTEVMLIDWKTTLPAREAESENWLRAILGITSQLSLSTATSKTALTLLCTASGLASGSGTSTEITKHTSVTWLSPSSIRTGLTTLTASCLESLRGLSPSMSTATLTGRVIVHDSALSPSTLCAIGWLARLI